MESIIGSEPNKGGVSEVRTFFRFCPACGKRFHIKLVGKKLAEERTEKTEVTRDRGTFMTGSGYGMYGPAPVIVEEKVPLTINVEDFQYTYKCKHCGHVWTEIHEEEH